MGCRQCIFAADPRHLPQVRGRRLGAGTTLQPPAVARYWRAQYPAVEQAEETPPSRQLTGPCAAERRHTYFSSVRRPANTLGWLNAGSGGRGHPFQPRLLTAVRTGRDALPTGSAPADCGQTATPGCRPPKEPALAEHRPPPSSELNPVGRHISGPIRFPLSCFTYSWTLSSKFFSTFPRGTCPLSVSHQYLALDGIYHALWAAFSNNPTPGKGTEQTIGRRRRGLTPAMG